MKPKKQYAFIFPKLRFFLGLSFLFIVQLSIGQNLLRNGSFEGSPMHSTTPNHWIDCGFEGESPPDIHPSGAFTVVREARHGDTYLGMVARDNETWERLSQKLLVPLQKGHSYELSGFIARSDQYLSVSKMTDLQANYNGALQLRIWGSNNAFQQKILLAETGPIQSTNWKAFQLDFKTEEPFQFLIIEAYYVPNEMEPYNGNFLLDNLVLMEK